MAYPGVLGKIIILFKENFPEDYPAMSKRLAIILVLKELFIVFRCIIYGIVVYTVTDEQTFRVARVLVIVSEVLVALAIMCLELKNAENAER